MLAEIDRDPPDEIWCLGDTVGYGPRPNECCDLVRERAALALVGNHDLVALGAAGVAVEDFNPEAGAASRWTSEQLTGESRAFLSSLRPRGERDGAALFHGSPRDPVWEYVLSDVAAADALELAGAPLVLVGHSHVPIALRRGEDGMDGGVAEPGLERELGAARWLLNPGSVGQPRDGDPRASFLRLDLSAQVVRFGRVTYPVARTQSEIRERGLPDALAERLTHGL